jgi:hypothetical protein
MVLILLLHRVVDVVRRFLLHSLLDPREVVSLRSGQCPTLLGIWSRQGMMVHSLRIRGREPLRSTPCLLGCIVVLYCWDPGLRPAVGPNHGLRCLQDPAKHSDRICQISLDFHTTSQIEKLWTAMQVPFPELTVLCLSFEGLPRWYVPPLPDSFLGGSAPHLRRLYLHTIPFPGIPKLLLSATHLVTLYLHNIPHSGYISPEAMVTCLSMLTNLEILHLLFTSSQSRPDQEIRRSPPPTRSILPALTKFSFEGVNEYLEDLVSWIDSPRLYQFWTTFFYDIEFDTPEFIQFVGRTLTFGAPIEAHVVFGSFIAWVGFGPQASHLEASHLEASHFEVGIICSEQDWLLLSLARICTLSLPPLSMTESLFIREKVHTQPDWRDGIECTEWLELLLPFTAVKDLYLSKQFAPRIAPALQELAGGRRTEVLPTLQNLFLEGFQPSEPVQEGIAQFISARRLTNRPVAISVWERDLGQEALYN